MPATSASFGAPVLSAVLPTMVRTLFMTFLAKTLTTGDATTMRMIMKTALKTVRDSGFTSSLSRVLVSISIVYAPIIEPVMLNFIFTTCTTICPVQSAAFSQVQQKLGAESDQVRMISFTIDPEHDTPERLRAYARRFGAGPQWQFLTGNLSDIVTVQKTFNAYRGNKMSHEPLVLLRASPDASWVRLDGMASATDIVREYRQLVSD